MAERGAHAVEELSLAKASDAAANAELLKAWWEHEGSTGHEQAWWWQVRQRLTRALQELTMAADMDRNCIAEASPWARGAGGLRG